MLNNSREKEGVKTESLITLFCSSIYVSHTGGSPGCKGEIKGNLSAKPKNLIQLYNKSKYKGICIPFSLAQNDVFPIISYSAQ